MLQGRGPLPAITPGFPTPRRSTRPDRPPRARAHAGPFGAPSCTPTPRDSGSTTPLRRSRHARPRSASPRICGTPASSARAVAGRSSASPRRTTRRLALAHGYSGSSSRNRWRSCTDRYRRERSSRREYLLRSSRPNDVDRQSCSSPTLLVALAHHVVTVHDERAGAPVEGRRRQEGAGSFGIGMTRPQQRAQRVALVRLGNARRLVSRVLDPFERLQVGLPGPRCRVGEHAATAGDRQQRKRPHERMDALALLAQRGVEHRRLVVVELADHRTTHVGVLVIPQEGERSLGAAEDLEVEDELERLVAVERPQEVGPVRGVRQRGARPVHQVAAQEQHRLVARRLLREIAPLELGVIAEVPLQIGRHQRHTAIGQTGDTTPPTRQRTRDCPAVRHRPTDVPRSQPRPAPDRSRGPLTRAWKRRSATIFTDRTNVRYPASLDVPALARTQATSGAPPQKAVVENCRPSYGERRWHCSPRS